MTYTLEQFGELIKQKHPDYKDIPSQDLARKMIKKYPQYRDQVSEVSPAVNFALAGAENALGKERVSQLMTDKSSALSKTERGDVDYLTNVAEVPRQQATQEILGARKEAGVAEKGIMERGFEGFSSGLEKSEEAVYRRSRGRVREEREIEAMPTETFQQKADIFFKKVAQKGTELGTGVYVVARPFTNALEDILSPYVEPVIQKTGEMLLHDVTEIARAASNDEQAEKVKETIKKTASEKMQNLVMAYEEAPEGMKEMIDNTFNFADIATMFLGAKMGKKIGTEIVEEVAEQAPKVAKATAEQLTKLKTALKWSKDIKGDIAKALDQRTIDIFQAEQLAKEFGVELPASSFATPAKAKTEQILGEGFFGGDIKKRAQKAIDDFSKAAEDIQSKAPTSGELGEEIVENFTKVEKLKKQTINALYDNVEDLIESGRSVYVDSKKTDALLDNLIKRKDLSVVSSPTEVNFLKRIKAGLGNVNLDVNRATLKDIGDKANFSSFTPTTDEKLFRKLYGTLKEDIDNSIIKDLPELADVIKAANKEFADFEALKQRPFAKSIKKLGSTGDVDTLADKLTKTKVSTNEVSQMYETLGEETTKKIQNKIVADIIEKAKSATGDYTPSGFAKQIKAIGEDRLKILLTPQQLKLIKSLDTVNQLIAKGTSVAKGSQTALIQQVTGAIKGFAAFSTGGTSLVLEGILAKIFGSKAGQSFLKGVDKKTLKILEEAAKKGRVKPSLPQSSTKVKQGFKKAETPQTRLTSGVDKDIMKSTKPNTMNALAQEAKKETIEQIASRMKAEGRTFEEFVKTQMKDNIYIGKKNKLDINKKRLKVKIDSSKLESVRDYFSGAGEVNAKKAIIKLENDFIRKYSKGDIREGDGLELFGYGNYSKEIKNLANKTIEEIFQISDKSSHLKSVKLEDVLGRDSDILKAYPQLSEIPIVIDHNINKSFTAGISDDLANGIRINPNSLNDLGKIKNTIKHEVQHVIQGIEGWETGTTYKTLAERQDYLNHFGEIQARDELYKYDKFDDIIFKKGDSKEAIKKYWEDAIKTKSQLTDIWKQG